jgi:hypothetical protein
MVDLTGCFRGLSSVWGWIPVKLPDRGRDKEMIMKNKVITRKSKP